MSVDATTRTPSGSESHVTTTKTAGKCIHYSNDGEDFNLGGAATGNVLNAAGGSGVAALGEWISVANYQEVQFAIAYSTATGTRRFHVAFQDFNATPGYVFEDVVFAPKNLGIRGDTAIVLAPLAAAYYHGTSIRMPCLGKKLATLLLLPGASGDPTVHAWGAPV